MDSLSGLQRLAPRCRVEQALGERVEARAGTLPADALQAHARALDEEEELVGKPLGLGIAGLAHQRDEPLALAALVRLDHAARRMARLGELDRGIGERAAAPAALGGELRGAAQEIAQLRLRVAGMRV